MAFTVVPDKSSGDPVTLAMWDSIKDNLNKGVMRPIATTEVMTPVASITFSSIPADYRDLCVCVTHSRFNGETGASTSSIRFNGDTGSNYHEQFLLASGSTAVPSQIAAGTAVTMPSTPAFYVPNYLSTDQHKMVFGGGPYGWVSPVMCRSAGVWANTAAVTSVTIAAQGVFNWEVGTRMTLYGIAGV